MIKEWCEACSGVGHIGYGVMSAIEDVCKECSGKGYTELEPDIKVDWDDTIHFTNDKENVVEVYIKELKE